MQKYFMDLMESNTRLVPVWKHSYNLKDYYGIKKITPKELDKIAKKIATDDSTYRKFCYAYTSESKVKAEKMISLGEKGKKRYGCLLVSRTPGEFSKCIDYEFSTIIKGVLTNKQRG
eukprot:TRINITY_DN2629_c0_g1_i1.p7 TRINITY_DN2629_c0_g1~~TRINITY_DN2629_c0_g1_i1.p7  ORF type:complete len:117 (+),score=17.00 TRINITY_DN2629_c0_g1_i1:1606-1956(+)